VKKKLQIAHAIGCLVAVIFIGTGAHAIFGSGLLAFTLGGIAVVSIGLVFRKEIAQWTAASPGADEKSDEKSKVDSEIVS
jgi:hypothetical protein